MTALWRWVRSVPPPMVVVPVVGFLLALPWLGVDQSWERQVILFCTLALLVSGLNLSLGYAGELAIGQAFMYAAGAYTSGYLATHGVSGILVQVLAAIVVTLVVGVITGVPGLRLGSWSLAMTSFFLVLLIPDIIAMFPEITGGKIGMTGLAPPTILGADLGRSGYFVLVIALTIAWFVFMRNLVTARQGPAFRVLKHSPVLASSVGISVFRMKLSAYAIAAVPAGIAGSLFANLDLYLSPTTFSFALAISILAASVIGGETSVYGALFGAAVLHVADEWSYEFPEYALIVYGLLLVLGGVLLRGGMARVFAIVTGRLDRAAGVVRATPLPPADESRGRPDFSGQTLQVHELSKSFGGNQALDSVSLTATPGEVTALIGPNGSGKTTLLNLICGYYRADHGGVALGSDDLTGLSPYRTARAGVARTFQTPSIPAGLTVWETVATARYGIDRAGHLSAVFRTPGFRAIRERDRVETARALELVGLVDVRDEEAASLPLGMRRLLEVARAIVVHPSVLLLDEVASGLDEDEIERLGALIRQFRADGGTVVLVEHNFQLVLNLADMIYVLARGELLATGTPTEVEENPAVLREYLGQELGEAPEADVFERVGEESR